MALDPVIIGNTTASTASARQLSNGNSPIETPLNGGAGQGIAPSKGDDANKSSQNNTQKSSDAISLSPAAQEIISGRQSNEANNNNNSAVNQGLATNQVNVESTDFSSRFKKVQETAVELKGIGEIAKNRNLNDIEFIQSENLKSELSTLLESSEHLSLEQVSNIAEKALFEARSGALPILAKINSGGDVTGDEFAKINDANRLLNKSNGLAIKGFQEISTEDQARLDKLSEQSSSFLESKSEEPLADNELDYVQRLQKEISAIEGYKLNIADSVGSFGVVI